MADAVPATKKRKIANAPGAAGAAASTTAKKTTSKGLARKSKVQNKHAAANAVLSTTELLENIILKVDAVTLLLAQRTSRKFQEVIKRSQWLQKKLFMWRWIAWRRRCS